MIDAKTQAEKLAAYQKAYTSTKLDVEGTWHPAWRQFHEFFTRRHDGQPLMPADGGLSTAQAGAASAASHWLLEDEQIAVNHVQTTLRTIVASTLNRDPDFSLDPLFPGFEAPAKARLASAALNNTWRKEKFNDPIKEAYMDSLEYGRGWVRHGWQSSFTRDITGEGPKALMTDALKALNEISRRGARLGCRPFTPETVSTHLAKYNNRLLLEDKPTIRRVSPFDMFFDPLAVNPIDARWIANRWRCPLAHAKANTEWEAKARKAITMTGLDGGNQDPEITPGAGEVGEYQGKDVVWIVDFFDLSEGTWCQFTENGSDFLRKPGEIPFPFGQPFEWIENIDDTASGQPISEVEVIWPHQRDLTSIAKELGIDRRQSRAKLLVRREDSEQLRPAFESNDQGMVVPVDMPPGEATMDAAYKFFKPESNAPTLMNQAAMMQAWITQASGVSDYLRGGSLSGETATGVNAMQMAAANYMGEKAGRVRDFIERNAQRTLMSMQAFSRLEYFVQTKAPDESQPGAPMRDVSVAFTRQHIAGSYRVIVGADSTEEKTPQAKQGRAQAIASTMVPFVQIGVVDPGQLVKFVLKEGFDIDDPTMLMTQQAYAGPQPPAPPGAEGQQQAQPMGGISMTPGTEAGQLGATAAAERTATGETIPQPEG